MELRLGVITKQKITIKQRFFCVSCKTINISWVRIQRKYFLAYFGQKYVCTLAKTTKRLVIYSFPTFYCFLTEKTKRPIRKSMQNEFSPHFFPPFAENEKLVLQDAAPCLGFAYHKDKIITKRFGERTRRNPLPRIPFIGGFMTETYKAPDFSPGMAPATKSAARSNASNEIIRRTKNRRRNKITEPEGGKNARPEVKRNFTIRRRRVNKVQLYARPARNPHFRKFSRRKRVFCEF